MATDLEFGKDADLFMQGVMDSLSEMDPDEVDVDLAMGVLTMEFSDGTKCVMNRQTAAHQIWLAEGASAWHFAKEDEGGWFDTKGRGRLETVLGKILERRLGRPVEVL